MSNRLDRANSHWKTGNQNLRNLAAHKDQTPKGRRANKVILGIVAGIAIVIGVGVTANSPEQTTDTVAPVATSSCDQAQIEYLRGELDKGYKLLETAQGFKKMAEDQLAVVDNPELSTQVTQIEGEIARGYVAAEQLQAQITELNNNC